VENFFNQIIQHESVAARERLDEAGGVFLSLHGDRGKLQAGNPAFRAGFQRSNLLSSEAQAHHLVEKFSGFSRGKAQVGQTQLGQLAAGAVAGQGQLGSSRVVMTR